MESPVARWDSCMKSILRVVGRLLFFPVILVCGGAIGLIAVLTHPRQVLRRFREKGFGVFESFTPEERKVILHIALGFLLIGVLTVAILGAIRIWK